MLGIDRVDRGQVVTGAKRGCERLHPVTRPSNPWLV